MTNTRKKQRHYGGSLSVLTGNTSARSISNATFSPLAGSFTYAFWFNGYEFISGNNFAAYGTTAVTDGWLLADQGSANFAFRLLLNGVDRLTPTDVYIPRNVWSRIVLVIDSVAHHLQIYSNGVQLLDKAIASWTALNSSGLFSIGASPDNVSGIPGLHSDVIYDVGNAWTSAQVLNDYNNNIQPISSNQHRWKLDNGAGTTAADVGTTATPLALTLSGGAAFSSNSPMLLRGVVRNLLAQSERLDLSPWGSLTNTTTSAYGGPFPSGVSGMTTLTDSNAGGGSLNHSIIQIISSNIVKSSDDFIVSGYAKTVAGSGWLTIGPDGSNIITWFDITNGVVGTTAQNNSKFRSAGIEPTNVSGIYRWHIRYGGDTSVGSLYLFLASANSVIAYVASGNAVAIGGIQIEVAVQGQTTPSPYVATGAAPLSVYRKRETRQNFTRYSENQTVVAHWLASNAVATLDGTLTPSGHVATKIADTSSNTVHYVAQVSTVDGGSSTDIRTFTINAKMNTRRYMAVFTDNGNKGIIVDLQTGTVANTYGATGSSVRSLGNGWYECLFRSSCSVTGSPTYVIYTSNGPTAAETVYVGDGSSFYVSKCQQVLGDYLNSPLAYIATTSTPANSSGAPRGAA